MIAATDRHTRQIRNPALDQQENDARLYQDNDLYNRASLVAANHPTVRLHDKLTANLPVYLRRRAAAAAILATGQDTVPVAPIPDGANGYSFNPNAPTRQRISQPPTDAQTEALAKRVSGAVKRLADLRPMGVSSDRMRAAFVEACQNGDPAPAWRNWIGALTESANRDTERQRTERYLGVSLTEGSLPTIEPGQPYNAGLGWPMYLDELSRAMNRSPMPKAAKS